MKKARTAVILAAALCVLQGVAEGARERLTYEEGDIDFNLDWLDDGRSNPYRLKFTDTNNAQSTFRFNAAGQVTKIDADSEKYKVLGDSCCFWLVIGTHSPVGHWVKSPADVAPENTITKYQHQSFPARRFACGFVCLTLMVAFRQAARGLFCIGLRLCSLCGCPLYVGALQVRRRPKKG